MKRDYDIKRDGFLIYKSHYSPISGLSDEQLGRLFRAIFQWQCGEDVTPGPDLAVAFGFFENQFRIDDAKYLERCGKNRENIKSRWSKNTTEYDRIQSYDSYTKHTDKDKEKDKDNVSLGNQRENNGGISLKLPFTSLEFVNTWNALVNEPGWRGKTGTALQMSLDELAQYDERFAIELMRTAIRNGNRGVVFHDTPARFEQWKQSHPTTGRESGKIITDINDLYKD